MGQSALPGWLRHAAKQLRDIRHVATIRRTGGAAIVATVRRERLTYLSTPKFAGLCNVLH